MNVFTVSSRLVLGRQTENGICTIKFPIAKWIETYGAGGTFHLYNKRAKDDYAYPVVITTNDEFVYWTPTTVDLQYQGSGEAQLDYTFGTYGEANYRKACSEIFETRVDRAIEQGAITPLPYQSWVTQVSGYADRAEKAATKIENMTATAAVGTGTGTPSVVVTKTGTSERFNLDFQFDGLKSGSGGSPAWDDIIGKPSTFPPSAHTHDDRYYTETEIDTKLEDKVEKVDGKGLSTNDFTDQYKLKVDETYLEKHSHDNKTTLDALTASKIAEFENKQDKLTAGNGIKIENNVISVDINIYEGPYEVNSSLTEQTLDTDNKLMADNVTINPIPVARVTNPAGGKTATIG